MHHRCLKTRLDILSHHIALHIDLETSGWLCAELIELEKVKENETS